MKGWTGRTRLTLAACVLAMVVVSLGAFTRLTDAGLGCPDWPGCYGHLTWPTTTAQIEAAEMKFPDAPVDTDKTWPEMVHRYFAGGLGLVILALAVMAWRTRTRSRVIAPNIKEELGLGKELQPKQELQPKKEPQPAAPYKLSLFLVLLVAVQAIFGMWTVTLKLWPQIVTTHLLGGFATLSLLWLLFLRSRQWDRQTPPVPLPWSRLTRLRQLALLVLVLVLLQITLGGWTSANYAALACIDLPTCHGQWLPPMDFAQGFNLSSEHGPNYLGGLLDNEARTAIHLSHRLGAVVVTLAVLGMSHLLWRSGVPRLKALALLLTAVLLLQVGLGITNIVAMLPLSVAVAHNGGGALLLLVLVTVNYQLRSRCRGATAAEVRSRQLTGTPEFVAAATRATTPTPLVEVEP